MALRHLWRHLAAFAAPLLLIALVAPPAQQATAQRIARVYILQGGDAASDQAAAQALQARGLNVTRGVATHLFDGTQVDLADYDVVVALYTANWDKPVPAGGLQAIRAFVEGGGSLVAGERLGQSGQLTDLMPATNCGWGSATSTTYSEFAPNARINAAVPASFTFSLGNFGGSEACLEPRADALVLYRSAAGGAGLVAWNVGQGRVAAFSTLLSATELANTAYRTLFQNTVAWSADVRDNSPPKVQRVDLANAGGLVRAREITINIKASDRGGAGVGSFIVAEYVFTSQGDTWRLASTSGWRRYRQPGATFDLTLADVPGVHYLHVYAADRAGNISRPEIVLINYQPTGPVPIGLDDAHLYRIRLAGLPRATARMQVFAGNPDLYVKGPGVLLTPASDAPVEEITFAARTPGVYELGVVGQTAGSYSLSYGRAPLPPLAAATAAAAGDDWGIQKRARGSVINVAPDVPPEDPSDLPEPPVDTSTPSPEPAVYLPAIQRP